MEPKAKLTYDSFKYFQETIVKRWLQKGANQKTISMLKQLILLSGSQTPSYKKTVEQLNTLGYSTSRGNPWTTQRLLRMLQRNNISGLHGLKQSTQP